MNNNAKSLLPYVFQTRQYGETYIHAAVRHTVRGWEGVKGEIGGREFVVTFRGWGRSLQSPRGHKYKAHARWADTDKPVPTKTLKTI